MTSSCSRSTETGASSGAAAAMATICWASTSSAFFGTTVVSMSPSRMRLATTAHSSRSARNLGKIRPSLVASTVCPARPIRCRPRATDLGDSTWITRSTAPMSIPSSSDEVATRHGSWPAFSISSTTRRSSRASEPWWARAISRSASSFSRRASRSAARRLLTNTIVERCEVISSSSSGYIAGQIERRVDSAPATGSRSGARPSSGSIIDSTGTRISRSSCLRTPVSTILHSRLGPTRNRPISSSGFWVAERAIR